MTEPDAPGGPGGDPPPRARRRGLLAATVVVTAVVVAVVAILVLGGDDDGGPSADGRSGLDEVSLPEGADADLTGLAAEVVALLEGRAELTYHATYEGTGGEIGEVAIEELRDGPGRLRTDSRTSGDGGGETRTLLVDGQSVVCSRSGDAPFTCTAEPGLVAADPFTGSIADQLAGVVLTETDTTEVGGRDARCFTFAAEDGEAELCIDERGIPLRLAVGDVRLELTALEDDVAADAFVPPAEPSPGVTIEDPTVVDDAPADG